MFEQMDGQLHDKNPLKTIVNLYMMLKPETKQADIAKRLGVNQVMVSRVLNYDEYEAKPEWIPVMNEMLSEIDLDSYILKLKYLSKVRTEYVEAKKSKVIGEIISKYLEATLDKRFVYMKSFLEVRTNRICLCSVEDQLIWEFFDIDTFEKFNENIVDWMSLFWSVIPEVSGKSVVFTVNENLFFDILAFYKGIQKLNISQSKSSVRIPDAVMLIDLGKESVICNIELSKEQLV